MKTAARRYIDVTKENRRRMAQAFSCTERFIIKALTYDSGSDQSIKIRHTAVKEYGGIPMAHYPECETIHDTVDGDREILRQVFANGATLRLDKQTGEVWITDRRGATVERRERIAQLEELYKLQALAENM